MGLHLHWLEIRSEDIGLGGENLGQLLFLPEDTSFVTWNVLPIWSRYVLTPVYECRHFQASQVAAKIYMCIWLVQEFGLYLDWPWLLNSVISGWFALAFHQCWVKMRAGSTVYDSPAMFLPPVPSGKEDMVWDFLGVSLMEALRPLRINQYYLFLLAGEIWEGKRISVFKRR